MRGKRQKNCSQRKEKQELFGLVKIGTELEKVGQK